MGKIKKVKSIGQLIPVNFREIDNQDTRTVNARAVYEFLEVREDFSNWIKGRIKKYDFIEGYEYVCSLELVSKTGSGGHNIKEYFVTLDMAKELCMVQNNPKGKEARQYFIQCEKEYRRFALREARRSEKRAQIEWQEARSKGKVFRRQETDAIKEYYEYAKANGSKTKEHIFYGNFTAMTNKILFGVKKSEYQVNVRDQLDQFQVSHLAVVDKMISETLREEISKSTEYHKIYEIVKNKVKAYAEITKPLLLMLEG